MTEKKKIVVEVEYSDGKLDGRRVTVTRWTEKSDKLIVPVPVAGFGGEKKS